MKILFGEGLEKTMKGILEDSAQENHPKCPTCKSCEIIDPERNLMYCQENRQPTTATWYCADHSKFEERK